MYCKECKAYKKNDCGCEANLSSYLINGMLGCHEADLLLDAYHFGQTKDNTTTSGWIPKLYTNGDIVRTKTNEELNEWFWWMLKYVQGYTDSRIALNDWLNQKVK